MRTGVLEKNKVSPKDHFGGNLGSDFVSMSMFMMEELSAVENHGKSLVYLSGVFLVVFVDAI